MNGYARFEKLAISDVTTFSLSYKFKTPEGVNDTKFDPGEKKTPPVSASLPELFCQQYNSDVVIGPNKKFNMIVSIVDKGSKNKIENISWAVSIFYNNFQLYIKI